MLQLFNAYHLAKKQIGTKEIIGEESNISILDYHKCCLLRSQSDEIPWCSAFVNWCFLMSGIEINPGEMQELLIGSRFSNKEIKSFFEMAIKSSDPLSIERINKREKTSSIVQLGTMNAFARSWLSFGSSPAKPLEGDLVILKRNNDNISGHVGFVKNIGLTSVDVLGGNQHDSVSICTFSRYNVLGYRSDKI